MRKKTNQIRLRIIKLTVRNKPKGYRLLHKTSKD